MSGWNDEEKLAAARALHNDFTGRSPGSRHRGTNSGGFVTGRGRGHGNTSPSPAHVPSDSGNKNMSPASQGRIGSPAPVGGGLGDYGSSKAARVGGRGVRNQPAAPLATSHQFFAHLNKENNTNAPAGSSATVSGTHGNPAHPTTQNVKAKNASDPGEPMVLDQPAQSSNGTANLRGSVHNAIGSPSAFPPNTQKNAMSTGNAGGPMDLDTPRNIQSTATPAKSESSTRGLMSSRWCTSPDASATGTGNQGPASVITTRTNTVKDTDSIGTHVEKDKRTGNSKNARFAGNTKPGLAASRWAESPAPPAPPAPAPHELSPVYRSDNWIKDLHEENASKAMHQADHSCRRPLGQRSDRSHGSNNEFAMHTSAAPSAETLAKTQNGTQPTRPGQPGQPAAPADALTTTPQDAKNVPALPVSRTTPASNVVMQAQASAERPTAYQFGTQLSGRHDSGFTQPSVGPASSAVDRSPIYQPSPAGLPRQGQPQQTQGAAISPAIGADASPNLQRRQHQVFGVNTSSAGPRAEHTPQHAQQPTKPANGNIEQQSTQPAQRSGNPFDDPDFKNFWENNYMRKNGQ